MKNDLNYLFTHRPTRAERGVTFEVSEEEFELIKARIDRQRTKKLSKLNHKYYA